MAPELALTATVHFWLTTPANQHAGHVCLGSRTIRANTEGPICPWKMSELGRGTVVPFRIETMVKWNQP